MRIGFGFDVHAFVKDRPLILGGVTIPYEFGLSGHSDADAVLHAIVDAMLGATAQGDIGSHFPSEDPRWKDQPSTVFLEYAYELIRKQNWRISNIDVTIVAQRPKMAPHTPAMRQHIASALRLELDQVSVKATTTDNLGFTGRGEGIACYATLLVER
ncbi:2-C-methyl-D-erythritol 2,4-cyclodiphosphate synthase [Thermosporothrix hazakensis]|jgi:2-C-methyl-D-erythritol 2,4-cyclodiphosphate synthase|uniref:2-C-methyl-D-erythritol 2,4-cyclodiphosphate synthase n=2 Tax=Thermosporothrix TaxID=768650 RepID=A0A326UEU5_THEHA|nr:2-C-methyl-D-erythritol 2,4-cyclodiphosphate synthase [Thermosporothrix hazakensis]PZW36445.1 2-C-methyl-D-erythritol 2,4-cyclodiphosphate synthase [Thermosporothrix hazakensis]BBH88913.1 2-C-methyl-D-erythritol 2,4-cyclodiphosphate synthase [Thermosporothrix sp. COM3]GCE47099.1 2-C-methyl-D-erythritol 2,4-cyclodiphosphate synthase [Thermosporothrix hazakensis]